jgi:short-subunit dehydrogenase
MKRFLQKYGPWAVVTGASEGIGREFALSLAAMGFQLLLVARRAEKLEALARELMAKHAVEAVAVPADLASLQGVERVMQAAASRDVGLLVAAAGFGTSGPFVEGDLGVELEMLDVNCRAVVALAHHFGGRFAAAGRGGFVLMSSLLAFQGVPRAAHYVATKAYIQTFAEGLGAELAPAGVDVIACAPGPIHSGFGSRARMRMSLGQTPDAVARATLLALGKKTTVRPGWLSWCLEASLAPLPRWGRTRILARVMGGMTRHR